MVHIAMALGLLAGLVLGLLAAATGSPVLLAVAQGSAPLGTLFVSAIRMVVIPLVMAVLFVGVTRLGDPRKLGRMGGTALAFYWSATVVAILLGMGLMHAALPLVPPVAAPSAAPPRPEIPGLMDFVLRLIPANPFEAATRGDLLALIVFTLLVAAAAGTLPDERRRRLLTLGEDLSAALGRLVHWILWLAPFGIVGLVAPATARMGWAMLQGLAVFVGTVLVGLAVYVALVYWPAVRFLGRRPFGPFLATSAPATIVAFSTTSGIPALPIMLDSAEELGLSPAVASFVIPLGASLHRSGSALFQGAALVFLASVYGVPLPPAVWTATVLALFLAALSVAPVPSASVMTLAPALDVAGIPLGGLALLLGVDRIPDMFRSAVNINGHMVGALVVEGTVGRTEDEACPPDDERPPREIPEGPLLPGRGVPRRQVDVS